MLKGTCCRRRPPVRPLRGEDGWVERVRGWLGGVEWSGESGWVGGWVERGVGECGLRGGGVGEGGLTKWVE